MLNILDLFAGIGGTAKGLQKYLIEQGIDYKYYAVDIDERILEIHKRLNPRSVTIKKDAYSFTIDELREYDFVWASPPCQTHSRINYIRKTHKPDMRLYELIEKLEKARVIFVVENVIPYYKPPIKPTIIIDRHAFWSNIKLQKVQYKKRPKPLKYMTIKELSEYHEIPLWLLDNVKNKRQILRNVVNPTLVYNLAKQIFPIVVSSKILRHYILSKRDK